MDAISLYSTWPNRESAEAAARALVEAQLIACANIVPNCVSVFAWDGAVRTETEIVMFAKTSRDRAAEAKDALLARHPYELPCIVALPIDTALSHKTFIDWLAATTA